MISREKAIELIASDKLTGKTYDIICATGCQPQVDTLNLACDRHINMLRELPDEKPDTKNGLHWIPCSKEPPKLPCLITDAYGNLPYIPNAIIKICNIYIAEEVLKVRGIDPLIAFAKNGWKGINELVSRIEELVYMNRIIAWMPVPKRYEE